MTVGERIKITREAKGISQEELAKRIGLKGKSSVCKIETAGDHISTASIVKYAKALNVPPSDLMGWTQGTGAEPDKLESKLIDTIKLLDVQQKEYLLKIAKMFSEDK